MPDIYVQQLGISIGEQGDGFVAISPTGRVRELNHSALFILDAWADRHSVEEVAELVREAFELADAPHELVAGCLADLCESGLVIAAAELPETPLPQPAVPDLAVEASPGVGRGVFARRAFAPGEVIERCPVVPLERPDAEVVQDTSLGRYAFRWGDDGSAIVLGFGSLYNHSPTPNAAYERHEHDLVMEFTAVAPIAAGDEILTDYTGGGSVSLGYSPLPSE